MHAAVGTDLADVVAASLAGMLAGPVICDAFSSHYYALVGCVPRQMWQHDHEARFLGVRSYVGIPAVHRTAPPGSHWVVLPRRPGDLCALPSVAALIVLGNRQFAVAADESAPDKGQQVYRALLAHIDGCAACHAEQPRPSATRIRRALRAVRTAAAHGHRPRASEV